MPTTSTSKTLGGLRRLATRFGVQAAIIAVGAGIAVGTVQHATYLPKPPVVERPFAQVLGQPADSSTSVATDFAVGLDHPRVTFWIERLTSSLKSGFEKTLVRKSQYDSMITAKLDARNMPSDLIYLAMIESDFNPKATSRVKAKGLWQFMAATARQFGLTVRGKTDERTNPSKATDAALTYLQQLKDRFGSWYLAAAAYNSGAGTVSKALRKVTGKTTGTDEDFFRIMSALPKETQDYVPKLIATARIANDPSKYGLSTGNGN
jgi:membrane-bound lytic murein transglycosylase D